MTTRTRPRMGATEARTFDRLSMANALIVATALTCGCKPYEDVFTYQRWAAQGMQVQRGQRAIRLALVKSVTVTEVDEDGEYESHRRLLGSSHVFCRCQVAARG